MPLEASRGVAASIVIYFLPIVVVGCIDRDAEGEGRGEARGVVRGVSIGPLWNFKKISLVPNIYLSSRKIRVANIK